MDLDKYGISKEILQLPAPSNWLAAKKMLSKDIPFSVQESLFWSCHKEAPRYPVAWAPEATDNLNISQLTKILGFKEFHELREFSIRQRQDFWQALVSRVVPSLVPNKNPKSVSQSGKEWFADQGFNISDACFTASSDRVAIAYSEKGQMQSLTYGDLEKMVNRVANGLKSLNVGPGSRVAVVMPMSICSVAAYIGVIRRGAIVAPLAENLAVPQLAMRLRDIKADLILTQDKQDLGPIQVPIYKKLCQASETRAVVLGQNVKLRSQDFKWDEFLSSEEDYVSHKTSPSSDCCILFSSGTEGAAKAIPWTHLTPVKSASDAYLYHDLNESDVVAWPSSLGWMMGPWLIFATLMNRATMALSDELPVTEGFGRFVQDAGVTVLGTVPSVVRSWRQSGVMWPMDWSRIKCFSSTGEVSNVSDSLYLSALAGYRPVIEYCGGTEIGGCYLTSTALHPYRLGAFATPALGIDILIEGDSDQGELFLCPPALGLSDHLLNRDHDEVYAGTDGLRRHGDRVEKVDDYFRILGRVDDTMNLLGIKVSSIEVETACAEIDDVEALAAISIGSGGPENLVIYAVSKLPASELIPKFQRAIRQNLNTNFRLHDVVNIDSLPRTASGKVSRSKLRELYQSGL